MKDSFVKRFLLTCNPWFLASTLFLLLGIYLVYVDPKLAGEDEAQMYISFSSLQLYELLCLAVVFLFRKIKLYYDSVFLIVIIAMLLFVPFITFNQALQYDNSKLEFLGYLALFMALLKMLLLKVGFKKLNLPWLFMAAGFLMLVMNFALPFIMKGLNLEDDNNCNNFIYDVFSIAVPVIGFLGYATMYNLKDGEEVFQSKWLPVILFQCFFTVTLLNVMSIMYVYDIEYNNLFYAMTLLVSAFLSLHPTVAMSIIAKKVILGIAFFLSVILLGPEYMLHFILVLSLILAFAISLSDRWLGLSSFSFLLILALGELPFVDMNYMQTCLSVTLLVTSVLSWQKQNWAYLLLPGLALELLLMSNKVGDRSLLVFLPMTLALFIAMLWKDESFKKNESLIVSLSILWAASAFIAHLNSDWAYSFGLGMLILSLQLLRRFYFKSPQPKIMMLVSTVVVLLWPLEEIFRLLKEQSFSIIVIIASFIIFLAGTFVTYSKRVKQI